MCCVRYSMRRSPPRTWISSQSIRLRPLRLASRFDPERSRSMGPFGNTRKGALSFCAQHAPEMIAKKGHVVREYVAVGNGENGGSLLDHQTIISDESSRAAYLES